MRKWAIAALAIAVCVVAAPAEANQGLFGGRAPQDGSINMRSSTTEQYDPIRGQSVAVRERPDFDPTPIDIGSFQLFPSASVAGYYDSNIYTRPTNTKDDVVWKFNPAASLASNWGRHAIALMGVGDFDIYTNNNKENYNGGVLQAEGRYDITAQTWLAGTAGYQRATEPRSSADNPGSPAEPTQYDLYTGGVEAYRGLGRLKAKVNYDFSYREYDRLKLIGGGSVGQTNRDRMGNGLTGEVSYTVSENFKPYVRADYDWRDYTNNSVRNSLGYGGVVGARMDFGGVTTGGVYVGYQGRDYYRFSTADRHVDIVDYGGNLLWNVTELTSVEAEISRGIQESTLGGLTNVNGATSYVETGGSLTVTHELRRNVLVEVNASLVNNDYQNSRRNDDNYGAGVGGRYFISRNFYSDLTYDFSHRDANAGAPDYDRHVVLLRFGVQN